jgi:hypothetical protein
MDVVYPVCCGIDVHQARLTACLRWVQEDGHGTKDVQEFDTTYPALLVLGFPQFWNKKRRSIGSICSYVTST